MSSFPQFLLNAKLEEIITSTFTTASKVSKKAGNCFIYHLKGEPVTFYLTNSYENKVRNFFKKKLDPYIPKGCKCFVCGGSVASFLLYQNPFFIQDFDIFVNTKEDLVKIVNSLSTLNFDIKENKNSYHFDSKRINIDVVKTPYVDIDSVFKNFDFNICKFGFTIHEDYKFSKDCSWNELFGRKLRIANTVLHNMTLDTSIKYLKRIVKYLNKGFILDDYNLASYYTKLLFLVKEQETFPINKDSEEETLFEKKRDDNITKLTEDYPVPVDLSHNHSLTDDEFPF